jgi:hypothetical protein
MRISRIVLLFATVYVLYLLSSSYFSKSSNINYVQDIEIDYEQDSEYQYNNQSNNLNPVSFNKMNSRNDNLCNSESYLADDKLETFQANGIGNPCIDQGTWENAFAALNPPLSAGGKDTMSQRLILNQVPTTEYMALVTEIKTAIANKIIDYATTCQEMHGPVAKQGPMSGPVVKQGPSNYPAILHDGKKGLTLACVTDPYDLKNKIIDNVYEIIYKYIKSKFDINMNGYAVYHDLNMHLNLMEGIIYPLQYSGLYTVHGVQYTNERWIRDKIRTDVNVKDALLTALSRRNIELEVDTDRHAQ